MWSVHRLLLVSLLLLTAARLVLAATTGIAEDEAHWLAFPADWHHAPTGPGLPAMLHASVWLLGDSALGLRWLMPWFALGCSLLIYRLARGMFDANTAAWSVVVLNVMPWFNLASVVVSPALPALFFWLLALLGVWLGLLSASRWSKWWVGAGLALAAATTVEPRLAVTLAGLPALMVLARRWRGLVRRPGPWLMAAVCALVVLVFAFGSDHFHLGILAGWRAEGGPAGQAIDLLLALSPLLLASMAWAFACRRDCRVDPGVAFLLAFALPCLLLLVSGFGGAAVTGALSAAGAVLLVYRVKHTRWTAARRSLARNLVLASAVLATLLAFNADLLRAAGIPVSAKIDALHAHRAWPQTAGVLAEALAEAEAEGLSPMVFAETPELAARLNLELHSKAPRATRPPIGLPPTPRRDHAYAFRPRADSAESMPGSPAAIRVWLVRTSPPGTVPGPPSGFTRALRLSEILRAGRPWRQIEIWEINMTLPPEW